jgi:hypothetical protein
MPKKRNSQTRVQEALKILNASADDFSLDDNKKNRRGSSKEKKNLGKNKLDKAS